MILRNTKDFFKYNCNSLCAYNYAICSVQKIFTETIYINDSPQSNSSKSEISLCYVSLNLYRSSSESEMVNVLSTRVKTLSCCPYVNETR